MSFLSRKSVVSYRCSCGRLKPLSKVYFCRHCFLLRCEFCVFHEIDSRSCSTCLESLTVMDALMKGNKCSNCLQCPLCESNLTTRIFSSKSKKEPDAPPIKSYYLCCLFCHWTTRDIGIPDATTSANKWPELENPHSSVINELVEYYKAVSINDRMARERTQRGNRRTYTHLSGLSVAVVRQRAGLSAGVGLPFRSQEAFQEVTKNITPSEAGDPVNDLPDDIYTSSPDLTQISTIQHRHRLPAVQPINTKDLRYFRKNFTGKVSLRCRSCEHNVIKPEYTPTSTKFKIQLSAYYLVPEVRIKTIGPLRAGQASQLLLLIINPTQHPTTVTLLPLEDPSSDTKLDLVSVPVKELKLKPNVNVELPSSGISIPGRDDAAEFDEPAETPKFNDDPNIVAWRKANQVVVKLKITPHDDVVRGDPVLLGFTLAHIYTNTVIMQEKKQLHEINHAFKLLIAFGKHEIKIDPL